MKKITIVLVALLCLVGCNSKKEDTKEEQNKSVVSNSNSNITSNTQKDNDESKVGTNKVNFYLFYLSTCPHCHEELKWLETIEKKYSYLNIIKYEVQENNELYEKVVEKMNIGDYHVPLTIIGSDYMIGYSSAKNDEFINLIEKYSKYSSCDVVNTIKNNGDVEKCMKK